MKWYKKLGATALIAALVVSSTACSASDTSWILKNGETSIPAGVYLYNMVQSYAYGSYMVEDPSKDLLSQKIEDTDATEWLKEKAMDNTEYNLSVLSKFNEMGLTLTEEELSYAKTMANTTWQQQGSLFEKNGIAKTSMQLLNEVSIMDSKIFDTLYGPGGEKEVTQEELKKSYTDNYMKVATISVSLPTKPEPAEDATDEDKKTAEEAYKTSLNQAQTEADNWYTQALVAQDAGKDFNDIINQRNKDNSQEPDSYDMTTNNYSLITKDSTSFPTDIMDKLKIVENNTVTKIEGTDAIVIVVRKDINEDPADFESVKGTVLHSLKDTEYTTMMTDLQKAATYTVNEDSVKRYTPKKIKLQ